MTRDQAREITARILRQVKTDEVLVTVHDTNEWFQPFSANSLLPGGTRRQTACTLVIRDGNRIGTTTINRIDEDVVREAIARAKGIASMYPGSDELPPLPGIADIREAPLLRRRSDDIPVSMKYAMVEQCIEAAKSRDTLSSGALHISDLGTAVATSNGLFAFQAASTTYLRFRAMSPDGSSSGFQERWSYDFNEIEPMKLAEAAISYCLAGKTRKELKPGRYDVILSHSVVADFLNLLMRQFQQKEIDSRMSFLTKMDGTSQLGQKLFPAQITMQSNPFHPALPSFPFTSEGEVQREQTWIDKGVITQVIRPRSRDTNVEVVPFPSNIIMEGGANPLTELISKTSRAVYINSVSNLQIHDPTNCLLAGITRDGLLMIEDGAISHGLKNMRFSETPVYMLKGSDILSSAEPVSGRNSTFPTLVPAIKMIGFSFLNATDIV